MFFSVLLMKTAVAAVLVYVWWMFFLWRHIYCSLTTTHTTVVTVGRDGKGLRKASWAGVFISFFFTFYINTCEVHMSVVSYIFTMYIQRLVV